MAIVNSYVSLPEGTHIKNISNIHHDTKLILLLINAPQKDFALRAAPAAISEKSSI